MPQLKRRTMAGLLIAAATTVGACTSIEPAPTSAPPPTATSTPSATSTTTAAPTPSPVLHADDLATVVPSSGLTIWSIPKRKGAKALTPSLATGAVVFLNGAKHTDGVDWWEIQPDWTPDGQIPPFGWVRATTDAGEPNLMPFAPDCPNPTTAGLMDPAGIGIGQGFRALSCFGDGSIATEGDLRCTSGISEGGTGGPSWINQDWWCVIDGTLNVHGALIDALAGTVLLPVQVIGRYRIVGHFDDPEARTCSWVPFGVSVGGPSGNPDPSAVVFCRQDFVATELTRLD
jgi:hypothetical protein